MKRALMRSAVCIVVLAIASTSLWADKGKTGSREMVGTVTVQWKDDGEASAITFTSFENDRETPFQVKLDKPAKALADLDGRRVALTGSFVAGKSKNTVSVKSFHVTLTGSLASREFDDEEDEEEPRPFAYLEVSEGGEDEEGTFVIVEDATSRRMVQEYADHRVEVKATLDEDNRLRIRSYCCVLTGTVRMQKPPSEEEDDFDDPEELKPVPVFTCNETGETHPIVENELCRELQKSCLGSNIEVVATLSRPTSAPAVTIHRYTTLHSGRIHVEEDDEGEVTSVQLVLSGAGKGQPIKIQLDGTGKELSDYHGERVTLTGSVREKDGVRWLTVRTIRG